MAMAPHSIEWHKQCLVNGEVYAAQLERKMTNAVEDYQRILQQNAFYKEQIDEATKQGKSSFEADKYLKSRRPRN